MAPPPIASGALPPIPARKRKAKSWDFVWAKPHPRFQDRYHKLLTWSRRTRPYSSEAGPKKVGPIEYARRKIAMDRYISISECMPRALPRSCMAGAIMDDETGEMKTKREITQVFFHFVPLGQFFGFSGSSSPLHVTRSGSLLESALREGSVRVVGLAASRSFVSWEPSSESLELLLLILR